MEKLSKYIEFINEGKNKNKILEMTGSPKGQTRYNTKEELLSELEKFGFTHGHMSKRNNCVELLLTNDKNSQTAKMELADDLGVEIMTYSDICDLYNL